MSGPARVLVTGASSGLGAALAREHARAGHSLALFARRAVRLEALASDCVRLGSPRVLVRVGDVGKKGDLLLAVRAAEASLGGLDVVYANAGYSQSGRLDALSPAQWRRQMRVNVEGVLNTLQACGPALARRRGRLGIVGSVAGFGSTTETGAYAASKAAVRAMAQILDLEWAGRGVSVTHIAPGFFASEIRLKDADGKPAPDRLEYIPAIILGKTEKLAHAIRKAVEKRRRELVVPKHAKFAVFMMRHFPGLSHSMNRRISIFRTSVHRKIHKI